MRDATVPVLAALGLGAAALATPAGPLGVASGATLLAVLLLLALLLVLSSTRVRGPADVVRVLALAAPFGVAFELAAREGLRWPIAAFALAAATAALGARGGGRGRRILGGLVAGAFALAPVADALGAGPIPSVLRVPTGPLPSRAERARGPAPTPDPGPATRRDAVVREGTFAPRGEAERLGASRHGVDAPWVFVPRGTPGAIPRASPLVRVVGASRPLRTEGRLLVVGAPGLPADARDLDGFDVVLLVDGIDADPVAARTLVSFVRRGGLLVGPSAPTSFGAALDRALGRALPDQDGVRGARALGAGRIARAGPGHGLEDLLGAGLAVPAYGSVFDRDGAAPTGPDVSAAAPRSSDRPLPFGMWLVLLAAGAAASVAARSAGRAGLLAALAVAAAASGALLGVAPPAEPPRVDGFVLDLGGPGGRRVEALRMRAGPDGWGAAFPVRSSDAVRLVGFDLRSGVPTLPPGGTGWVVTARLAVGGGGDGEVVATPPGWATSLLRGGGGRPDGTRLWLATASFRGAVPDGIRAPDEVPLLVVDPGRP